MNKWIVERYDFDETILQFKYGGIMTFKDDKELIKFIEEVMSKAGIKYLWRITKVKENEMEKIPERNI